MQHATSNVGRTGHQSAVIVVLLDMIDANMLANSLCTKTIEYLVVSNAFYYGCSVANDVRASYSADTMLYRHPFHRLYSGGAKNRNGRTFVDRMMMYHRLQLNFLTFSHFRIQIIQIYLGGRVFVGFLAVFELF